MQINLGTSLSGLRQPIVADTGTQWGDFPSNVSELPPSYVLVDQESDAYPNDYTGESNANVLTADDGNEVSATLAVIDSNTEIILAGWCESNLAGSGLPATNAGEYFSQSHVNNSGSFGDYVTAYGEIETGNTPTISNDTISIRMKYSGAAPLTTNVEYGFFNHTGQVSNQFSLTTSFADYSITGVTLSSATLDSTGGFYVRFNFVTTGTTNLHIDKIALVA